MTDQDSPLSAIPKGPYCYRTTGIAQADDGSVPPTIRTETCPFWKRHGGKPLQRDGYCRLLKAGDWMPAPHGTMLLWDQVKECGINQDDDGNRPESDPSIAL